MQVKVSSWLFEYQHDTPLERALRDHDPSLVPEPVSFLFSDVDSLLQHFDGPGDADRPRFQGSIEKRLERDPNVGTITAARTPLKDLKHFRAYRGRHYDEYHNAARRIASGAGTEKDRKLTGGFDAEVATSRILLEAGQVLFHGRGDDLLVTERPYPSYVSTTLDPIVALNSAYRRARSGNVKGRPMGCSCSKRVCRCALSGATLSCLPNGSCSCRGA